MKMATRTSWRAAGWAVLFSLAGCGSGDGAAVDTGPGPGGQDAGGAIDAAADKAAIDTYQPDVFVTPDAPPPTGDCLKLLECCEKLADPSDKATCQTQLGAAGANQGICAAHLVGWNGMSKCGMPAGGAVTVMASVRGAAAMTFMCKPGDGHSYFTYMGTYATVTCSQASPKLDVGLVVEGKAGAVMKGATGTPKVIAFIVGGADQAVNLGLSAANNESWKVEVKTWDEATKHIAGTAEASWKDAGLPGGFATVKSTFDVMLPSN
jgi:hypothetical protein